MANYQFSEAAITDINQICDYRVTQNRIIQLFREELGYTYLGNWQYRPNNSNIEEQYLTDYLTEAGYNPTQITRAIQELRTQANNFNRSLYDNNKAVYSLLRYGIKVKTEIGQNTQDINLINWKEWHKNHFAIAQEVTLKGNNDRRHDIVLYINGIAIGVIELKNSRVSLGDGIRQNISNQKKEFNEWFFTTIQILFAGSDSEGLKYGTIGTPEKYYLTWKEDIEDNSRLKIDKYLLKICNKKRLIELIYDFVIFDDGVKKIPRVHQYFAIKEAQKFIQAKQGGIIWHTQGSGKSIIMVLLAKWILENNPNARVAIITDRKELDEQIEEVFQKAGETIHKSSSGRDLMAQLSQAKPRLLCSLVHKFGNKKVDNFEQYIKDLKANPIQTMGEIFVFVDECHRTHSQDKADSSQNQKGKLHRTMKAILPHAVFIGFTGTP
ncbi:MAG: HsdR family type I site-specific deoxyribonuclease, partial [Xenococcus sp. (in: cyanobacteria)]